jgi:hypothetical protein
VTDGVGLGDPEGRVEGLAGTDGLLDGPVGLEGAVVGLGDGPVVVPAEGVGWTLGGGDVEGGTLAGPVVAGAVVAGAAPESPERERRTAANAPPPTSRRTITPRTTPVERDRTLP